MPLTDQQREIGKELLKRRNAGLYTPMAKDDPMIPIYREDPSQYMRDKLGLTLTYEQELICESIVKYNKVLVKASHGIGKSASALSPITLADGTRVLAKDLVGKRFKLLTHTENGIEVVDAHANWHEFESVYKVTTEYGREFTRNAPHPLYTATKSPPKKGNLPKIGEPGWKALRDLKIGDLIAVPTILPTISTRTVSHDELKFSAYILGDGGVTQTSVKFTQNPGIRLDEFKDIVEKLGCNMSTTRNRINQHTVIHKKGTFYNPCKDILIKYKIMGCGSKDKRVPNEIFSLCNKDISIFLSRLYSTDGCAYTSKKQKRGMVLSISFTSISKGLCQDIQELLLRFGICSNLSVVKGKEIYYVLKISSAKNIIIFKHEIGIFGKEDAMNIIYEAVKSITKFSDKWRYKNLPEGLKWEKIKSIEYAGEDMTVGICVPGYEHYLTPYAFEHNSYISAGLALWFYDCYNPGKVITSAPNAKQVATIIWGQMRDFTVDRKPRMPFAPKAPILGDGPSHFALGITSKDANGFQGIHHENMLIIFDEAVGIRRDYWIAADHMCVGDTNKFLAICNPTDISSMAYEMDMKSGGNGWHVISISSLAHPNILATLKGEPEPFKGAISLRSLMSDIHTDCEEVNPEEATVYDFEFPPGSNHWYKPNGMFESRCMGRWPSSAVNTIWGDALWAEAINADLTYTDADPIQIGCDPGYLLDNCAIHVRKGSVSLQHESHKGYDTSKTAGRLKLLCEELGETHNVNPKKIKVLVDSTGMGQGVIDQRGDYNFIGINSSSKAVKEKRYPNRRSELWFTTKERVLAKNLDLHLIGEEELEDLGSQLKAPVWAPDNQGKVVVEPKKETKKRLGRSPDDADAFNLAYADEFDFGPPIIMGSKGGSVMSTADPNPYNMYDPEEANQAMWAAQRKKTR